MIATLATGKAEDKDVRAFAEKAADEYKKAQQDLDRAVRLAKVEVPAGKGPAGENMVSRLDDQNPGAFDLSYVTQRLIQHKRMVDLFTREAENGQSPALKRFAADTLPLVQTNTQTLEGLQKRLTEQHQSQQPPKGG